MTKTKVTKEDIANVIVGFVFSVVPDTQITFCTITLRNGAKVVGYNYGAIDPKEHSTVRGEEMALAMAKEKVWELEGYLLRQKLYEETLNKDKTVLNLPGEMEGIGIVMDAMESKGEALTGTSNWCSHICKYVVKAICDKNPHLMPVLRKLDLSSKHGPQTKGT